MHDPTYTPAPHTPPAGVDIFDKVFKNAVATAIVAMMGTVPGYVLSVAFIEKMGRK